MDIENWLRGLGLQQYEALFRENAIDGEVLAELNEADLEKLGLPLGHRKRLMKAIAALGRAAAGPAASSAVAPAVAVPAPKERAERRQLTVMFCDLVGSTALSARLDPEDMRVVIRAYQDACSGIVARYDGFVAKFMGDGVLAYFGYPRAHEDDAERAVRAGLEMTAAVRALKTPAAVPLAARVGIATGLVVVGDLVGEGAAQEQAVVGDTPNLAARLQGLAEPGAVVVAAATRRLLGELFELRALRPHALKGFAEPVEAWAVEGVASSESRFEAAHAGGLTGFIGRERELGLLDELKRRAWGGEGQVVLVSGEAGIGKSRIAAALAERIANEPHTRLRYQCSPYHTNSALYPFIAQLERAAAIKADDPPGHKLDRLEAMLGLGATELGAVAPLFAALLSISFGMRYPALALSPAQQRRQTLAALLDQFEGLAHKQPVLLLFEDVHWADATSLEALDLAVERLRRLPVLAIFTFRPEFEPPWAGLPNVTTFALGRLERGQALALIERVSLGKPLPEVVSAQIVAKTDGIPLFVEELTKTVLESGLLIEEADRYRLDGPLPPLAIPATLQDSLMARLDRLAPVKEIAQTGAAIGREFSFAVLKSVSDRDEVGLAEALAELEAAELVFRRGEPPDSVYTFKHALVQDTAYASLLKSRRQVLHRRIAEALRDRFPAQAETEPEVVAHHFKEARLNEPATEWWGKAGDRALRRSAFKEAIAHFEQAIGLAEALTDESGPQTGRLRLQIGYGNALIAARGHGAPETTAAFERAQAFATGVEDDVERFSIHYGRWVGSYLRGELAPMLDTAEAFLRDAERRPGMPEAGVARRVAGITRWFQGDYLGARDHLERALAIYDPERDRDLAFRFGQDAGISAMAYLARVLWPLGEIDRSRSLIEQALARAEQSGQVATLAYTYAHKCIIEAIRHDPDRALANADALADLSLEHGLALWTALGTFFHGWAHWHAGERPTGLAEMRKGLALQREQGNKLFVPLMDRLLADIEARAAAVDAKIGLDRLDAALAEAEQCGQRWYDAELHRARGALLLVCDRPDAIGAAHAFQTAIAIAQAQKARSFELRAALDLAKLHQTGGRNADAHAVLGPALEGFAATPEFPEIEQAQAVLADLAETAEVKAATAQRQRRLKLQIAYGNALIAARGHGAPETSAAFERARELAAGSGSAAERLSADYGLWVGCFARGEAAPMRAMAEAILRDAERRPDARAIGMAHRNLGCTRWYEGDYVDARRHFAQVLTVYDAKRDRDLAFQFGQDYGAVAMIYLALVLWPLGAVDQARRLAEQAITHATAIAHVPTLAYVHVSMCFLEGLRRDPLPARDHAETVVTLGQEHGLPLWLAFGVFFRGWARWCAGDKAVGLAEMRAGLSRCREQDIQPWVPLTEAILAEAEAEAGGADAGLYRLDAAIAEAERVGQHWYDAELERVRGALLLRRNPADAAAAEAGFARALDIARSQGTRSFALRAALDLAKLYQSTGKAPKAGELLAPALAGFAETAEFPEIAEAERLLATAGTELPSGKNFAGSA